MTKAHKYQIKSKEDFYKMINLYACVFDVTFYNLRSIAETTFPLSSIGCNNFKHLDDGIKCSYSTLDLRL